MALIILKMKTFFRNHIEYYRTNNDNTAITLLLADDGSEYERDNIQRVFFKIHILNSNVGYGQVYKFHGVVK